MTTATPDLAGALTDAGFDQRDDLVGEMQQWGDALKMSDNGPYKVLHVFTKGDVFVQVETTNAPLDLGGMDAQVQYPPVCIVEGPKGRVACRPEDTELVVQLAGDMA